MIKIASKTSGEFIRVRTELDYEVYFRTIGGSWSYLGESDLEVTREGEVELEEVYKAHCKREHIKRLAEDLEIPFEDIKLSNSEPMKDLEGLPSYEG